MITVFKMDQCLELMTICRLFLPPQREVCRKTLQVGKPLGAWLNRQLHHRMNFPNSVVRHVLSTVALIFRCMAYVPERFPNNCNDRRLTEGQLLRSATVKRKPCGSPTKNGCANLTPLRFCRHFTDNNAGLVTSYIVQRNMWVAIFFNFQFNNAAFQSIPLVLSPG